MDTSSAVLKDQPDITEDTKSELGESPSRLS